MEDLLYDGFQYASAEAAELARREHERVQTLLSEGQAQRARAFEERVKARFESAGGSPEEWTKERASILAAARLKASVDGDDAVRRLSSERYGR